MEFSYDCAYINHDMVESKKLVSEKHFIFFIDGEGDGFELLLNQITNSFLFYITNRRLSLKEIVVKTIEHVLNNNEKKFINNILPCFTICLFRAYENKFESFCVGCCEASFIVKQDTEIILCKSLDKQISLDKIIETNEYATTEIDSGYLMMSVNDVRIFFEKMNLCWFEQDRYKTKQGLQDFIESNLCAVGSGHYTIKELVDIVCSSKPNFSFVQTNLELNQNIIPFGRKNDLSDIDRCFYEHTKDYLSKINLEKIFFINYTGHPLAVGSALAEKNIPIIAQFVLDKSNIAEEQTFAAMQDYANKLKNNTNENKQCCGLLLFPPHGKYETRPSKEKLPTIHDIKDYMRLKKVVIFTECAYKSDVIDYDYFNNLKSAGLEIEYVGVDCNRDDENNRILDYVNEKEKPNIEYYEKNLKI